ncbi:MAG: hypothetical protein ACE1ZU_06265, partial [bacterium]
EPSRLALGGDRLSPISIVNTRAIVAWHADRKQPADWRALRVDVRQVGPDHDADDREQRKPEHIIWSGDEVTLDEVPLVERGYQKRNHAQAGVETSLQVLHHAGHDRHLLI